MLLLRKLKSSFRPFTTHARKTYDLAQSLHYSSTSQPDEQQLPPTMPHHAQKATGSFRKLLQEAFKKKDVSQCISLLEQECKNPLHPGINISKLFCDAINHFPPKEALQIFNISKQYNITPTPGIAVSVIKMYASLGWYRHIEKAVHDMLHMGLAPHWSVFFHWYIFVSLLFVPLLLSV